ncbi:HD domain-containing phosphohydrolase [Paraburkholderia phymatum]|uniref:Transcriptional regulator, LuxR family n=1 Tax=Paraburkholderia phymatum (strain DSM 17167 / CIP 108236 / LMG 21445 / STM815) TaxID=391038 RepID=B2JVC1_PARP8|nr:HD domain-containing phosphohydrolase [Paraburkholderia phymatum]ACC74898.1 transcriptional regulator, LuxR family [Paraburkholderia phymatum STM815]
MQTSPGPAVRVFDAVKALAFIGDLSMGQPTDHSIRTAWLAVRLARAAELDDAAVAVCEASLLRWSGCTANAAGFAEATGDDVASREAMLALKPDWAGPLELHADLGAVIAPLARIHCEVSSEAARMLGLGQDTRAALRHVFESWDGSGSPDHLAGNAVPASVFIVALAGELEIFSRTYNIERARALIGQRADSRYPDKLARLAIRLAPDWLDELEHTDAASIDAALLTPNMSDATPVELVADIIDLKLPWMTGYSRSVAATAASCGARLALDSNAQHRLYCAGLIHGMGRAAVPNPIWNTPSRLSQAAWEKLRLVPYWTSRAGRQTGTLAEGAELGSYVYERLDGSGYFRGASGAALPVEARILAASATWVALRAARPWRAAMTDREAAKLMQEEAAQGRYDASVVDALIDAGTSQRRVVNPRAHNARLSAREIDVLRGISQGASNKEVARDLSLSPSTVRTHVESVFRKLDCSTRAAATLKALALGLL